jgi:hypothetical protein
LSDDGAGTIEVLVKRASISSSDMDCDEYPCKGALMEACAAISRSSARTMAVAPVYPDAQE